VEQYQERPTWRVYPQLSAFGPSKEILLSTWWWESGSLNLHWISCEDLAFDLTKAREIFHYFIMTSTSHKDWMCVFLKAAPKTSSTFFWSRSLFLTRSDWADQYFVLLTAVCGKWATTVLLTTSEIQMLLASRPYPAAISNCLISEGKGKLEACFLARWVSYLRRSRKRRPRRRSSWFRTHFGDDDRKWEKQCQREAHAARTTGLGESKLVLARFTQVGVS
jgi:hypothetical protein